jgi:hypothetical protein
MDRRRRVCVIADVRTFKKLSLSLLPLPDLGIHPSNLLPKIPVMRQEENYTENVCLIESLVFASARKLSGL